MKLAKVVGTITSTIHDPSVAGRKLLLCDYLDLAGKATEGYVVAVDTVGAGVGEVVLILDEGNSARQVLDDRRAPIRAVVAAIVDAWAAGDGRKHTSNA